LAPAHDIQLPPAVDSCRHHTLRRAATKNGYLKALNAAANVLSAD
jgi:hypothetical protein